jgi:hypothetical protein
VGLFPLTINVNKLLVEGRFNALVYFQIYVLRGVGHLQSQNYLSALHEPEFANLASCHSISLVTHSVEDLF